MRAMILAAGLGTRMGALTARVPKPLLEADGESLLAHQIRKLVAAGIRDIVINHHYHGAQIEAAVGDGSRFGARVRYSPEPQRLETAGGIIAALPLLEDPSFLVVNADIWTDYSFSGLGPLNPAQALAHLILVDNPPQHPAGDFVLQANGGVAPTGAGQRLTFSGISVLHRDLFAGHGVAPLPLLPVLHQAMAAGRVTGEHFTGDWADIGTPERLQALDERLRRDRYKPGQSG